MSGSWMPRAASSRWAARIAAGIGLAVVLVVAGGIYLSARADDTHKPDIGASKVLDPASREKPVDTAAQATSLTQ